MDWTEVTIFTTTEGIWPVTNLLIKCNSLNLSVH